MERECLNCGVSFVPKRSWQRFHIKACRAAYHSKARVREYNSAIEEVLREVCLSTEQKKQIKKMRKDVKKT